MSQPAPKRTAVPPTPPQAAFADRTGRFRRAGATVLPPPGVLVEVMSPEEVGAELELDAQAPERGITSGVFGTAAGSGSVPDADLAALADSLIPYYREGDRRSERAELAVEDLSLRFDNPYVVSSLVPPSHKPSVSLQRVLAVGLGIAAAAGVVAFGLSRSGEVDAISAKRLAPAAAPAVAAPLKRTEVATAVVAVPAQPEAPVAAAAPQATVAPASAATAQPEQQPRIAAVPLVPKVEKVEAAIASPSVEKANPAAPATLAMPVATAAEPPANTASAVEAADAQATETPAAEIALPEIPSRTQVSAGFDAVRGALESCAAGKHGVVDIDATVSGAGRVTHALIAGVFKGSPEGSCMARAVRAARFPQFSRASLKVSYPIAL